MHNGKEQQCHLSQETRLLGNDTQSLWVFGVPPKITGIFVFTKSVENAHPFFFFKKNIFRSVQEIKYFKK